MHFPRHLHLHSPTLTDSHAKKKRRKEKKEKKKKKKKKGKKRERRKSKKEKEREGTKRQRQRVSHRVALWLWVDFTSPSIRFLLFACGLHFLLIFSLPLSLGKFFFTGTLHFASKGRCVWKWEKRGKWEKKCREGEKEDSFTSWPATLELSFLLHWIWAPVSELDWVKSHSFTPVLSQQWQQQKNCIFSLFLSPFLSLLLIQWILALTPSLFSSFLPPVTHSNGFACSLGSSCVALIQSKGIKHIW